MKTFVMALEVPPNRRFTVGKWYEVIKMWGGDGSPVVQNDKGRFCNLRWNKCNYLDGGDWLRYDGDAAPPDGWQPDDPTTPAIDLSNRASQTFDAMPPEVQAGLRALPFEEVEIKTFAGRWVSKSVPDFLAGYVCRQKPAPVTFHHPSLPEGEYVHADGTKIIITRNKETTK